VRRRVVATGLRRWRRAPGRRPRPEPAGC